MPTPFKMIPIYRASRYLLTVLIAAGLFLLIHANPLAQSNQRPASKSHINDLAGLIDAQTRSRLEGVLERLKEKSKLELYVALVETTDGVEVSEYSQRLAREWNVGSKTSRGKSLLLVISAASKSSFTQYTRAAQTALPDGLLGEMSYRMSGPLSEGRFTEAVEVGVYAFVNAVAQKMGFNAADLERPVLTADGTTRVTSDAAQPVLVSASDAQRSRPRTVSEPVKTAEPVATPPAESPRTDPTPVESPSPEPTATETPKTEPSPTETPKADVAPTEITELPKPKAPKVTRKTSPIYCSPEMTDVL